MARARTRYCPKGHDKDAPGGSRWFWRKTAAGSKTRARICALCSNDIALRYYHKHKSDLPAGTVEVSSPQPAGSNG